MVSEVYRPYIQYGRILHSVRIKCRKLDMIPTMASTVCRKVPHFIHTIQYFFRRLLNYLNSFALCAEHLFLTTIVLNANVGKMSLAFPFSSLYADFCPDPNISAYSTEKLGNTSAFWPVCKSSSKLHRCFEYRQRNELSTSSFFFVEGCCRPFLFYSIQARWTPFSVSHLCVTPGLPRFKCALFYGFETTFPFSLQVEH